MSHVFSHLKLRTRLLLVLASIVLIQALISGSFTLHYIKLVLEERIGEQALQLSRVVSEMPQIRQGLVDKDPEMVQHFAELIRAQTTARFIVVGDRDGIRYSHPLPERIGKKRVGGDNQRALEGESYVSRAIGSLGPSLRGKAPVLNLQGNIIGVTSVGYMLDSVEKTIGSFQNSVLQIVLISLIISILVAIWISSYFKRVMFGLEPEEIAQMFEERNTTLQTIREGIISIDASGAITTINKTAMNTLGLGTADLRGQNIRQVLPQSDMWQLLQSDQAEYDREIMINGKSLIVNRVPITMDGEVTGVVSSFRLKDDIELLSRQLSHIEQYADTLRAQSHDFANKLHTIAGLIQINETDRALELIGQESLGIQELVRLLTSSVSDPVLAGCILGKYNRAHELGLELDLDSMSHMGAIPDHIPVEGLVSMVGNIIDNAFEATRVNIRESNSPNNHIHMSLNDFGDDLVFEVTDNGAGVAVDEQEIIFEKGISSKPGFDHGYGLYLVKTIVDNLGGQITVEPGEGGGTRFIVYLPKRPVAADLAIKPEHSHG
jgi:two-component system CitB family sensor kinase